MAFWTVFGVVPKIILYIEVGLGPMFYQDLRLNLEWGLVGYFNSMILMPRLFDRGQYTRYFMILIGTIVFSTLLSDFANFLLYPGYQIFGYSLIYAALNFTIFAATFSFGHLVRKHWAQEKRIFRLEQEKLKTELDFLKAQINPHLLFNTLNTLYSYSLRNSDQTPEMILKLAELMRYMLYETNSRRVALGKELDYLKNYISLQQMRIQNRAVVDFSVEGKACDLSIAPMLLISFIENAFKHRMDSVTRDIRIRIAIEIRETDLLMEVINNFENEEDRPVKDHSGIGLANTVKRLKLLYPNAHHLKVDTKGNEFFINLRLELS